MSIFGESDVLYKQQLIQVELPVFRNYLEELSELMKTGKRISRSMSIIFEFIPVVDISTG